jgi:hypothetical protein
MTAEEIRREKADALLELGEAEERLELLRRKAEKFVISLQGFTAILDTEPERGLFKKGQATHGHSVQETPQAYVDALEPEQYFALADEIRKTKHEITRLTALKSKFR